MTPEPERNDRPCHRRTEKGPRRLRGRAGAALPQAPHGRPLHLPRPHGPGRLRPRRRGAERAAAPAHRPVDGHLSVRGRGPPPRQPRQQPGDPPRRGQLDDRRQGHRPLRAHRPGRAGQGRAHARHAGLGRPADRKRGRRPLLRQPRTGRPAVLRARRPVRPPDRRRGVRGQGQGADPFAAVLCPLGDAGRDRGGVAGRISRAGRLCRQGRGRGRGPDLPRRPDDGVRAGPDRGLQGVAAVDGDAAGRRADRPAADLWNFVASTQDRLDAAKADWKAGRFVLPPDDKGEFIPLPEETYTGPMHKPEASA